MGLEETIKTEVVNWSENRISGWEFVNSPSHINAEAGVQFLSELYYDTDAEYLGRTTVPAIVDYKTNTIVNNDFRFLTNYLESEFRENHMENAPDLYPYELRKQIDDMNEWLYVNVNDAIYRTCFANSVEAYNEGYNTFFGIRCIRRQTFRTEILLGVYVMDSDIRLYSTLVRMDLKYLRHIGPSKRRLVGYKNLWEYCRELYQIPAFSSNTYFQELAAVGDKRFKFNPYYDMVVPQTDYEKIWSDPTSRCALSKRDKGIFLKEGRFS
ncbi:MAG: glutathione S-transferase [Roseburia inulinivorans]